MDIEIDANVENPKKRRRKFPEMIGDAFKLLADPTKRRLIEELSFGAAKADKLADKLEISKRTVSRHLSILHDEGFVEKFYEGRTVIYQLNPDPMHELIAWLRFYSNTVDEPGDYRLLAD